MLEAFITELLRVTTVLSAGFNFFVLVFFYERDGGSKRKLMYSVAALLISVGQLYVGVSAYRGVPIEWPEVGAQVGLTVVIAASLGSVKRMAASLIDHCGGCRVAKRG